MKPRRWFLTPQLVQWRYMTACGSYAAPFFWWPRLRSALADVMAERFYVYDPPATEVHTAYDWNSGPLLYNLQVPKAE